MNNSFDFKEKFILDLDSNILKLFLSKCDVFYNESNFDKIFNEILNTLELKTYLDFINKLKEYIDSNLPNQKFIELILNLFKNYLG